MTEVTIEYCVPCGHLDQAIDLQRTILERFGQDVDGVTLETGEAGVFEVSVDGELIYDKEEEAYDEETIVDRVSERVPVAQ